MGVAALVLLACSSETTLQIAALDPGECKAHCISSITVSLDGQASEHRCGTPIEVGPLLPDRTHTLVLTTTSAYGLGLRQELKASAGSSPEVELPLAPSSLPRITQVELAPGQRAVFGHTRVVLQAELAAPAGPLGVQIAGVDAAVVATTTEQIEIEANGLGPVVLEHCGVASEPVELTAPALRERIYQLDLPGCPNPRFVSGTGNRVDGTVVAVFGCGTDCSRTRLVSFDPMDPERAVSLADLDSCPVDVAARNDAILVGTETSAYRCNLGNCLKIAQSGRYEELGWPGGVDHPALGLLRRTTGGPTELVSFLSGEHSELVPGLGPVASVFGRYVLGRGTGAGAVLVEAQTNMGVRPTFGAPTTVSRCPDPRMVRRFGLLLCGTGANQALVDSTQDDDLAVTPLPIPPAIDFVALPDASMAWVWTSGQLYFVDLAARAIIGYRDLPPGLTGRRLGFSDQGSRAFTGGPEPGQIIAWYVE